MSSNLQVLQIQTLRTHGTPRVDFANILSEAFTHADPKSANRQCNQCLCPVRKTLVKSTQHNFINNLRTTFARVDPMIPKAKKDSQVCQSFTLSGSAHAKAELKHVDEIDPWSFFRETLLIATVS